jgi:putative tricarboxylic transport membrane protein
MPLNFARHFRFRDAPPNKVEYARRQSLKYCTDRSRPTAKTSVSTNKWKRPQYAPGAAVGCSRAREEIMADWVLAFLTVVGALIYLRATANLPHLEFGDTLGPQVFPAVVGIGLVASGLLLMVETWRKRPVIVGPSIGVEKRQQHRTQVILAVMVAWTAAYYAVFEPIGYIAATILYLFPMLTYFHKTHWWMNLGYAVAFTTVAYLLFANFLHVALPIVPFPFQG